MFNYTNQWGRSYASFPQADDVDKDKKNLSKKDIDFKYMNLYDDDDSLSGFSLVVAHELGHAVFGLGDEYPEFGQTEPRFHYPNCATPKQYRNWWSAELKLSDEDRIDPFATELEEEYPSVFPKDSITQDTKFEPTTGACYGQASNKNVYRPSEGSIMSYHYLYPVFGIVNTKRAKQILKLFSGKDRKNMNPEVEILNRNNRKYQPSRSVNFSIQAFDRQDDLKKVYLFTRKKNDKWENLGQASYNQNTGNYQTEIQLPQEEGIYEFMARGIDNKNNKGQSVSKFVTVTAGARSNDQGKNQQVATPSFELDCKQNDAVNPVIQVTNRLNDKFEVKCTVTGKYPDNFGQTFEFENDKLYPLKINQITDEEGKNKNKNKGNTAYKNSRVCNLNIETTDTSKASCSFYVTGNNRFRLRDNKNKLTHRSGYTKHIIKNFSYKRDGARKIYHFEEPAIIEVDV
ncbi:MAG: M64 family metallo-endopeptidase, partial [Saprospiraceae bacterium]|nr:M64 family metallo-endopeptidase [Saprospiraceae bacterium]